MRLLLQLLLASWVFVMFSFGALLLRETFRRSAREMAEEEDHRSATEATTGRPHDRVS